MTDPKQASFATVVKKKELADGHFILWLKPSVPFTFEPGQYLTIGKNGTQRPYSIASAPDEEMIELFLETVPKELQTEKSLTPKLFTLKVGETVSFRLKAKGKFILDRAAETHVMISTVTGVAPFISMIRSLINGYYGNDVKGRLLVFQGASYCDEFGYLQELQKANDNKIITYVPTISRPKESRNAGWTGQTGRVNLILDKYFEKLNITPSEKTKVYLCGHRGMIEDLGNRRERPGKPLGRLVQKGFQTLDEVYF